MDVFMQLKQNSNPTNICASTVYLLCVMLACIGVETLSEFLIDFARSCLCTKQLMQNTCMLQNMLEDYI
jgi:hypothetical protein